MLITPTRPEPALEGRLPLAESARVLDRTEDGLLLEYAGTVRAGRIALSCLVQPEPGDLALVARTMSGLFVIALLERSAGVPMRLVLGAKAEIVTSDRLALLGGGGVTISSPETVGITASSLDLRAGHAQMVIDELVHVGQEVRAHVGKLRLCVDLLETIADRVLTRAQRCFRFVTEGDHLRAGDIDHRGERSVQLRGGTTFVSAETVVKVDAEQIHMG